MFLDTAGLLSLHHPDDEFHASAAEHFQHTERRVTTNYVLAELVALMEARRLQRQEALAFIADLDNDPSVEILWVRRELHQAGMDLLWRRLDKSYSLCDAVSFLLMRDLRITEALTTDHHFEQEGFTRLLH